MEGAKGKNWDNSNSIINKMYFKKNSRGTGLKIKVYPTLDCYIVIKVWFSKNKEKENKKMCEKTILKTLDIRKQRKLITKR